MSECFHIFFGYDDRMCAGTLTCIQSLVEHASIPVSVTPLKLSTLSKYFKRPRSPMQLTDFTYTRFLAPSLCGFKGWCLFIDANDMMIRADVAELYELIDDQYAVMCVHHPSFDCKEHSFMNKAVKSYPMLNWSSVILFNNAKCTRLTVEYVESADYYDLHQFKWTAPGTVGELPSTWNHLVRYYPQSSEAKIVH